MKIGIHNYQDFAFELANKLDFEYKKSIQFEPEFYSSSLYSKAHSVRFQKDDLILVVEPNGRVILLSPEKTLAEVGVSVPLELLTQLLKIITTEKERNRKTVVHYKNLMSLQRVSKSYKK